MAPNDPEAPAGDRLPDVIRLIAHPVRWQLLHELARSDRLVRELTAAVGEPQNLVSYHLGLLRRHRIVASRRSSADGRDVYYSSCLDDLRAQLDAATSSLHPGLRVPATAPAHRRTSRRRPRVLFLCTGNSARSQIAEALLTRAAGGLVDASSAGSHPKTLHPNAVRVLGRRGIDISANRTRHLDEFRQERLDVVVTVCDRVRATRPEFRSDPTLVHWSLPDPSLEGATNRASYPAFERTAIDLERRVRHLVPHVVPTEEEHHHA